MNTPRPAALARRLFVSVRREGPSAELRAKILVAGRGELGRGGELAHAGDARMPDGASTTLASINSASTTSASTTSASINSASPTQEASRTGITPAPAPAPALDATPRSERAPALAPSGALPAGRTRAARRVAAAGLAAAAAVGGLYLALERGPEPGVRISAERSGASRTGRASGERATQSTPDERQPMAANDRASASRTAPPGSDPTPTTPAADAPEPAAHGALPAPEAHGAPPARAANTDAPAPPRQPAHAADRDTATPEPPRETHTSPRETPRTPPREDARPSLGEQLAQIKRARAALRAGDHARALRLLDAYRAQPGGAELAAEASLLRIETLAASGQRDAAARAARKFASDYPNSPLIDRALGYAAGGAGR